MNNYYNNINNTECYIYYIAGPLWNELKNIFNTKKETYIASNKFINLQKDKIIFILINSKKIFKLVSICTTKKSQCINSDNIKIFNSLKLNENIIEVTNIFIFENIIVPDILCNDIIKDNTSIIKINSEISNKLMALIKTIITNDNDSCTHIESEYNSDEISTVNDNSTINSTNDDLENDAQNNNDESQYSRNKIPIKIYKCKYFNWETNKRDCFKKHYKSCKYCEIINNNDNDLIQIIDNCVLNFHKKNEDNVEKIIDAFNCAIPTDTFVNSKNSHINIYDFKKNNFLLVDWYA